MRIVIDANILFSALIKDSTTRKLILEYEGSFLFPEYIFIELEKYKEFLVEKSQMYKEDFDTLLTLLLNKVVIVPNEVLHPYQEKALALVKEIDINDVLFVACVLAYPNSVLWSEDKALKKLREIPVFSTKEIIATLIERHP